MDCFQSNTIQSIHFDTPKSKYMNHKHLDTINEGSTWFTVTYIIYTLLMNPMKVTNLMNNQKKQYVFLSLTNTAIYYNTSIYYFFLKHLSTTLQIKRNNLFYNIKSAQALGSALYRRSAANSTSHVYFPAATHFRCWETPHLWKLIINVGQKWYPLDPALSQLDLQISEVPSNSSTRHFLKIPEHISILAFSWSNVGSMFQSRHPKEDELCHVSTSRISHQK